MTKNELRDKMRALKREVDTMLDGVLKRDGIMTAEEKERWEKQSADLRSMGELYQALDTQERREVADAAAAAGTPPAPQPDSASEFRNLADFVGAVQRREQRALSMGVGAEGGVLVPTQLSERIMALNPETEIVLPRVAAAGGLIPAGEAPDAAIEVPYLVQGASGALGGLTFGWVAEGGSKPATDYELQNMRLEPKEYAAHVVVTDKLLRNSAAASQFLTVMLNRGMAAARDQALLNGTGAGKPLGILKSPGAILVARNTGSTILFADVLAMDMALLPESYGSAVWLASVTSKAKLIAIKDDANNNLFVGGDVTKGVPSTLFGRPIVWTGKTPTLGNQGDLALVDFSMYMVKQGSGPFIAASEHVYFTTNKTVVKAFANLDGQLWVKEPLVLEDGSTEVSPVVILK